MANIDVARAALKTLHRNALTKVRMGAQLERMEVLTITYAMSTVEALNDMIEAGCIELANHQQAILDHADAIMETLMEIPLG